MFDPRSTSYLLADGPTTIEIWRSRHDPDRPTDALFRGYSLRATVRRLLAEPGNRRLMASLIEDERWCASPLSASAPAVVLVDSFIDLVERGLVGMAYRESDLVGGAFGGGAGSPTTTPVETIEPLVRPGIDDINAPTYIAVALSDEGLPSEYADYELLTDGARRPGQFLDSHAVWIEPIDPRARCSITLEHIPVPAHPRQEPALDEPQPVEPVVPAPELITDLEVIILDEEGQPVFVPQFQVLHDGEAEHEGAYQGTPFRIDEAADDGSYAVTLEGLRLPLTEAA